MNRSAVRPHRLIFSQDGATACTDLLETLLVQFRPIWDQHFAENLRIHKIQLKHMQKN